MMQINNIVFPNTKAVSQTENNLDVVVDKERFSEISKIIINDEMNISEEGQELSKLLFDQEMLDPENIKIWENNFDIINRDSSSEKLIDDIFIDLSLDYKNKLKELEASGGSEGDILKLNETYINDLEQKINSIADDLDSYFDRGRSLSEVYSEEAVEDLFDEDLFKDNLRTSILSVKDYIMNSEESSPEEIYENLLSGQKTTSLEKMSFNDLKVLHSFIKEPPKFGDSINRYNGNSVEKIADKEKEMNKRVRELDVSSIIKDSMFKVNQSVSDGMLKHIAYMEEQDKYENDMQEYYRLLNNLLSRISGIKEIIEAMKEDQGVSPKNSRLIKYLGMKQELTEQYKKIKSEKNERVKSFTSLKNNKYTIVEYDSYKGIKAQYDDEMEKE